MRKFALSLVCVAGLAVVPAAGARPDHTIVPFRSIGGVSIGMTPKAVRSRLGAPKVEPRPVGAPKSYVAWFFDRHRVEVDFSHGDVDYVSEDDPAFVAPHGVRVGAPWSTAHAAYDDSPCGSLSFQCTFTFVKSGVQIQPPKGDVAEAIDSRGHGQKRTITEITLYRTR